MNYSDIVEDNLLGINDVVTLCVTLFDRPSGYLSKCLQAKKLVNTYSAEHLQPTRLHVFLLGNYQN